MKNFFSKSNLALFALVLLTVLSCKKDEDDSLPDPQIGVVASFQSEVSATNPLEVTFSNFSSNATSYSWDFGDGGSSTEESPVYTYTEGGSFTVTLTASDGTSTSDKSETITVTDPNAATNLLSGSGSKTWYLQREGIALGIGPGINDNQWWQFGGATPLGERPCILDDQYIFHSDGTFEFNSNGTLWIDLVANGGWETNGIDEEACFDESDAGVWGDNSEREAFANGGNYTYDYDPGANSLVINGLGAYIGLCNKTADGDNNIPLSTKAYRIFNFVDGDVADSLQMAIEVSDGNFWNFYLVSYDDISALPDIPGPGGPTGNDYPNQTPTAFFNTFASTGAADVDGLIPTESAVTITPGVADPAGGTPVGEYIRGTAEAFSDLKFALDYDIQLTNFTTVSVDVYFPSSNDYSGALSQQVDIFIADAGEDAQFWTTWELYVDDTQTAQDEWVTITFNLGNALNREDLDMIGLKIGGENHFEDGTFYVRNFKFE